MFGTILLSVCTLMHVYVLWRTASVPFINRHLSGKVFVGVSIVLWVILFLGRYYGHGHTGILAVTSPSVVLTTATVPAPRSATYSL